MTWHSAIFQPYSKKTSAAGLLESLIPRKIYDTTPINCNYEKNRSCTDNVILLSDKQVDNENCLTSSQVMYFFTLDSKRKATSSMSQALSPPK